MVGCRWIGPPHRLLQGGKLRLKAKGVGRSDLVLTKGKANVVKVTARVSLAEDVPARPVMILSGIEIKVGQSATVVIGGLTAVSSNIGVLVDATVKTPGKLTVTGRAPGQANILVTVDGESEPLYVKILP